MLTYEGDVSNYLVVNIKNNPDRAFELPQSHLINKIIQVFCFVFEKKTFKFDASQNTNTLMETKNRNAQIKNQQYERRCP